ncbi:MAG: tetraacyldisaccharide 4'-kinase [Deltaproteobacteria bacterium]|nr:tetraacyldisaccharide 4'-kinase [Deltaproteobacteria bacterium]
MGWVLWLIVLPLSIVFSSMVRIRNFCYARGWIRNRSLPCAVVSVGNLTVGGTGKTPTTLWLAGALSELGYRVAILSRGYRGRGRGPRILGPGGVQEEQALNSGDEPVLMAELYGHTVGVGKRRFETGSLIIDDAPVDVFLLDDGFQHRRLKRDLDLLLLGQDWRGWMLPAGPFREPRSALRRAHLYLITGARSRWDAILARRSKGPMTFRGRLAPRSLLTREDEQWVELPLAEISSTKMVAVSGIADPEMFYRMVQEWGGIIVDTLKFPDHHDYSIKDWQEISRAVRQADRIITTEKDLVKLAQFPFARGSIVALRVEMVVERGEELIDAVENVIQKKRESRMR